MDTDNDDATADKFVSNEDRFKAAIDAGNKPLAAAIIKRWQEACIEPQRRETLSLVAMAIGEQPPYFDDCEGYEPTPVQRQVKAERGDMVERVYTALYAACVESPDGVNGPAFAKSIGVHPTTAQTALRTLKGQGRVTMTGHAKGALWSVV